MLDCCRTRRRGVVGYSERSRERSHADAVVRGGLERGESKDRVSPSLERCDREGREREREREREISCETKRSSVYCGCFKGMYVDAS